MLDDPGALRQWAQSWGCAPAFPLEQLAHHHVVVDLLGGDPLGFQEGGDRGGGVPLAVGAGHVDVEHRAAFQQPGPRGLAGLRFHDLRRTAATLALAAGADTREPMERLGHTSPQVALRYQHVVAGRDQAGAAALDELVQAAATLAKDQPPPRVARGPGEGVRRGTGVAASPLTWSWWWR